MTADAAPGPASPAPPRRWRSGQWLVTGAAEAPAPAAPAEQPVAIVIDGQSQAVLMATPSDLQDLATGFALTEGMIDDAADIQGAEIVAVTTSGLPAHEARLWLRPGVAARLSERRRQMLGPVGCGLCGIDSIDQALPAIIPVTADLRISPADIGAAMAALTEGQVLYRDTPAIHGACFRSATGDALVREDVGRHNALDKLIGALARDGRGPSGGIIAMTSRMSVDLVQKSARMNAPVLVGAGAPTALGIRWAEACGITLIGRARRGDFDLYTHPERMDDRPHG